MRKAVDAVLRAGIMRRGVRAAGLALILALQAAGIPDMTVVASEDGEFIAHWWNLIKIGDYYYHADATPFGADPDSGLLTLDEFRDFWEDIGEVDYLHQFDEGNYPKA
ncbi:MAG: hypothetical protein K6E83_07275 [Clostridium sp.]|nr:hypothetical protein [Clostridium sp.]